MGVCAWLRQLGPLGGVLKRLLFFVRILRKSILRIVNAAQLASAWASVG